MSEDVRRDLFGSNGRAPARRFGRVLGDEELHGVLAEHWSTATGKQWVGRSAASLREPDAQCRDAMSRERRDAFFAAFAVTADMRPVREDHIRALQPDELSHPQPGLDGECQERVVAPADPGGAVGALEQRDGLLSCEERDERPLEALLGDGEHALDRSGVLRVQEGRESEHRVDGGEAGVPRAGAVVALGFEVVQERTDERGVEITEVQLRGS
jgi:hypothetical protein